MKIVGFVGIATGIAGVVLTFIGFGDFETNNFMIGGILASFGLFIGVTGLIFGFIPEISKLTTKTTKNIQQENKEDLFDIASNAADIMSDAIKKTTKSVKNGIVDKKFCKHCGENIDLGSKFCNKCGKEQ